MTTWGIADLHLSFARPDRRERFAARWADHALRIESEWKKVVRPEDLVLIPGDVSMAANHRDLQSDLAWLERLPGTKVLGPGNHDRWWNSAEAVRPMLRRSMQLVDGDAIRIHGLVVCGTRGVPPRAPESPESERRAAEELGRLGRALASALALREVGEPIVVLWHYPPFDQNRRPGPCVALLESSGVAACIYGHLHAEGQWSSAVQGTIGGVRYQCVAADAIGFRPLRIPVP